MPETGTATTRQSLKLVDLWNMVEKVAIIARPIWINRIVCVRNKTAPRQTIKSAGPEFSPIRSAFPMRGASLSPRPACTAAYTYISFHTVGIRSTI